MDKQEAYKLINSLVVADRMYFQAQTVDDHVLWLDARNKAEQELIEALVN